MTKVINLRQARKSRARAAGRRQGDENAARFGRTRAQAAAEREERDRDHRILDGHRIDEADQD